MGAWRSPWVTRHTWSWWSPASSSSLSGTRWSTRVPAPPSRTPSLTDSLRRRESKSDPTTSLENHNWLLTFNVCDEEWHLCENMWDGNCFPVQKECSGLDPVGGLLNVGHDSHRDLCLAWTEYPVGRRWALRHHLSSFFLLELFFWMISLTLLPKFPLSPKNPRFCQ